MDIEIPIGNRTALYRFLEILPGVVSYGAIILLIVLSIVNPVWASIYLLIVILSAFVRIGGRDLRHDGRASDDAPGQSS